MIIIWRAGIGRSSSSEILNKAGVNKDIRAAPFLHKVLSRHGVTVYQVKGVSPPPASPLLKGQYVHCMTTHVRF